MKLFNFWIEILFLVVWCEISFTGSYALVSGPNQMVLFRKVVGSFGGSDISLAEIDHEERC